MPFDGANYDIGQQDEVLNLLRRARERVARPGGWCKGEQSRGSSVCAWGALYASLQEVEGHYNAIEALRLLDKLV